MIEVISKITIHEIDGHGTVDTYPQPTIQIKNCCESNARLILDLNGMEMTIIIDELIQAINNARGYR